MCCVYNYPCDTSAGVKQAVVEMFALQGADILVATEHSTFWTAALFGPPMETFVVSRSGNCYGREGREPGSDAAALFAHQNSSCFNQKAHVRANWMRPRG